MDSPSRITALASRQQGSDLLLVGGSSEVLARIVEEDPLALRARVAEHVRSRALLCDVERVLLTAQVLCALDAPAWRDEQTLSTWLDSRVEEALAFLLAEEDAEETTSDLLQSLATPLALDTRALVSACRQFNRLPHEQREAFCALVLDARAADGLARERGLSLSELARRARAGLSLLRPVAAAPAPTPGSTDGTTPPPRVSA